MAWNGSGTYSLPPAYSPEVNGTTIDATRYNGLTNDVATGISAALAKNGENVPTANLPMGGFKHTGAAAANASGQYLVYGQELNGTFGLGAAATPSITFTGDTNTGFWSPGADTAALSVGGTEVVRWNSVGFGVNGTPATSKIEVFTGTGAVNGIAVRFNAVNAPLAIGVANSNGFAYLASNAKQVSGSDNQTYDINSFATRLRMDNGQFVFARAASGTAGNTITWSDSVVIDTSGNVGIGVVPTERLHVGASSGTGIVSDRTIVLSAGNNAGGLELRGGSSASATASLVYACVTTEVTTPTAGSHAGALTLHTANAGTAAERARIVSSGEVLVARTGSAGTPFKLQVGDGTTSGRFLATSNDPYSIGASQGVGNGNYYLGATAAAAPDAIFSNNAGTQRFGMTDDGRFFGRSLHNNAGSVTGTTNQYVASGTYTPTLANVSNTSALTAGVAQWIRVGNVVHVVGSATGSITAASATTAFTVTIPIASNLTAAADLNGSGGLQLSVVAPYSGVMIEGSAAFDLAIMAAAVGAGTAGATFKMTWAFSYEVK